MYKLIRKILFFFDAETVHHATFGVVKFVFGLPFVESIVKSFHQVPAMPQNLMGLTFPNPVGLAAGFDKDAKLIDELACVGFGFIEIGTLTPKAQDGNPLPRLFRLPADQAIINRMGFNNGGVVPAIERLRNRKSKVIVGGNIGKNKDTPNENAHLDYQVAFDTLFNYVDYFVVNVSSPNTPNLRDLQEKEPLKKLLLLLQNLNKEKPQRKPILLKIAPDLTESQLLEIVEIVKETNIQGVIATNTTISRTDLKTSQKAIEKIGAGGLSGKPVSNKATEVIRFLRNGLGQDYVIIGVGGIFTAADAQEKIDAGANLVQVYTGLIYEGTSIVKNIVKDLKI